MNKKLIDSLFNTFLPIIAVLLALLVGAVILLLIGANPIQAYGALINGAFGSKNALANTVVKATPLLLVGLGIAIAFRSGVINIGGEGQMILGALFATIFGLAFPNGPAIVIVPLALIMGFIGGAVWGGIPGYLKAKFNVNEILSTIMMNAIAVQLMNFLLRGILIEKNQLGAAAQAKTARLARAYDLPRLKPTQLHLGAAIAVILAFLVYILLWRTSLGYRIRAVGLNTFASRYGGISTKRTFVLSMMLSGAFCGLAGAIQIYGINHRMVTDGTAVGFTGGAGFNGIVAALFGQLHPLGIIPSSFFFGALMVGGVKLQRISQVPAALITTLNGLIVIFVVSSEIWRKRRARKRAIEQAVVKKAGSSKVEVS